MANNITVACVSCMAVLYMGTLIGCYTVVPNLPDDNGGYLKILVNVDEIEHAGEGSPAIEIPFTIRNELPDTIYVEPCGGGASATLERRTEDAWTPVASGACILLPMPRKVLSPGRSMSDLHALLNFGKNRFELDTEYRLCRRSLKEDIGRHVPIAAWLGPHVSAISHPGQGRPFRWLTSHEFVRRCGRI